MRAFEERALEYVRRQEVELPIVVGPALAPMELQLFHRYLHATGLPAYHSIEDYRGENK